MGAVRCCVDADGDQRRAALAGTVRLLRIGHWVIRGLVWVGPLDGITAFVP